MKSLRQVGRPGHRIVITVMPMIDQWILEDERELEARCARFRIAKLALDRSDGGHDAENDADGPRQEEADPAA
ncbi:hypothetical protein GCM10022224_029420 [Nonomuraea antimicrobica]|uniref:Uncharacterized protein n=2 Tax=Nonomuraea antimicrobica TaxID=561173 RepID=A0ABP7BMF4_9ACTN